MTVSAASPKPDVLRAIVAATRRIVETRKAAMPPWVLEEAYEYRVRSSQNRLQHAPLEVALARPGRFNVIAECKRRSPSKGVLCHDYDPASIARGYRASGARAISVLTEPTFFDGALEHLERVERELCETALPLVRKDFIVDKYQVLEAVAHGATAILLIVAALSDDELDGLHVFARSRGLDVLVEVHDRQELDRALSEAGARCIGVNNRSLKTLDVSLETAFDLVDRIPERCVAVAESGLRRGEDLARLRRAGYDAFLIGERFMTEPDPGRALAALLRAADRAWEALA